MDEVTLIKELVTVAPVVGVLGWWVYSLKSDLKDIKEAHVEEIKRERLENSELTKDYKKMAEKSIEILTLTDDKLKKTEEKGQVIQDIHRIVNELNALVKNHLIK